MSSINKSGTRFVPKLTVRNKTKPKPAFPQTSSQFSEEVTAGSSNDQLPTPQSTQGSQPQTTESQTQIHRLSSQPSTSLIKTSPATDINKPTPAVDDSSDDDDDHEAETSTSGNNNTFKPAVGFTRPSDKPLARKESMLSNRRPSISSLNSSTSTALQPGIRSSISFQRPPISGSPVLKPQDGLHLLGGPQRRLSSLSNTPSTLLTSTTIGQRSRQGSFSASGIPPIFHNQPRSRRASSVTSSVDNESEQSVGFPAPTRIGIPLTLGANKRRRRSSAASASRPRKRTSSVSAKERRASVSEKENDSRGSKVLPPAPTTPTQQKATLAVDRTSPTALRNTRAPVILKRQNLMSSYDATIESESVDPLVKTPIKIPSAPLAKLDSEAEQENDSKILKSPDSAEPFDTTTKEENPRQIIIPKKEESSSTYELLEPNEKIAVDLLKHIVTEPNNKWNKVNTKANRRIREEILAEASKNPDSIKYVMNPVRRRVMKVTSKEYNEIKHLVDEVSIIDSITQIHQVRVAEHPKLLQNFSINESKMTLDELCKPNIPIGKESVDFEQATKGDNARLEQRAKRCSKRKLAKQLRIPLSKLEGEEGDETNAKLKQQEAAKRLMDTDVNEGPRRQRNVELQTDENGNIIYNRESTLVDRHNNDSSSNKEKVDENPFQNPVTSATYSKKGFVDKWTPEETAEFYQALSTWGTDFGLIAQLFPYRTRRQVKSKFITEERKNPHFVEMALVRKAPTDVVEYSTKTGKDFKTLEEYSNEIRELKIRHDKEVKEMKALKEKARLDDLQNSDQNQRSSKGRSRRQHLLEFRKNEEVVGTVGSAKN